MGLMLATSGCATKKFVRNRIDPLAQRVESAEKQNQEQDQKISELEDAVSRADERAQGADHAAREATALAQRAQQAADQAQASAGKAAVTAQQAVDGIKAVEQKFYGLVRYELAAAETVLFPFESSRLTAEAQATLDNFAGKIPRDIPYVIEVQGFTDRTGSAAYNLALSQRRAEAVARYLTLKHNVPLRAIHMLGVGSEAAVADNSTREGRRQNRRVELRLYVSGLQVARQ